jgi:hypothetical protein
MDSVAKALEYFWVVGGGFRIDFYQHDFLPDL